MTTSHLKSSFTFLVSLIVAVFVFSTVQIPVAYACSCAAPMSPRIELAKSAAVFAGKVTNIETTTAETDAFGEIEVNNITFEVEKSWKNVSSGEITITTPIGTSCGFNFSEDESYVVYAFKNTEDNTLNTNLCSRTNLLANAQEDIDQLGDGTLPMDASSTETQAPQNRGITFVVIGIVIATGVLMIIKKKGKNNNSETK